MKKMICCIFVLLLGMVGNVNAKPFPTLKSYVVNGIVITNDISFQEIQKRLGKPTRSKKVINECAEQTDTYYYYPTITFKNERVDEIFFSNPKNQLRISTMTIDANTSVASIKKLGKVYESHEKEITTYRLEDPNDPSAWIFDFKADHLFSASYFSDDC
jgi:hypothetical protein